MSKSLIIDPGHGGVDGGGDGFGALEKDWNLKISRYQYDRLKELGASVAMTRTTDKTLDSGPRTNLIKDKYDYCMSNHFNAFNGSARGVETIHSIFSNDKTAKRLADAIVKESGLPFRRVFSKKNSNGKDYYFMHRLTGSTTTIIVEYGFIDNKQDNNFYKRNDNFYNVAEAVVKEWCAILGVTYVTPKSSVPDPTDDKRWRLQTGLFDDANSFDNAIEKLSDKYSWLLHEQATSTELNPRYRIITGLFTGKNVAEFYADQVRKEFGWNVYVVEK